ncbi:hypothetical protein ACVWXO_007370 [Bradyrhizobium sp. LM2.7]
MVRMKVARSGIDVLDADLGEDRGQRRKAGGQERPDLPGGEQGGFHIIKIRCFWTARQRRHCERSEAIQTVSAERHWIASLCSQ